VKVVRIPSRCDAGFTILEVLVAMAILLVGMTAVIGLLTFGMALSRTAHLRANAASAMEAVTADLEESFFPIVDGEAGEPKPIVAKTLPGAQEIVYSAIPHQNPDEPLEYRVDVEMSWNTQGVQREESFSFLLLREIPFGERLRRRFVALDAQGAPPATSTSTTASTTTSKP
jgi:prepilin-type N-terminal cleavage/methylation domain-containing protein